MLGAELVRLTSQAGHDVLSGYNAHFPPAGIPIRLNLKELGEIEPMIQNARPEIIIHTAAVSDVDLCEEKPAIANLVNGDATGKIGEVAEDMQSHVVYVSTDYVFDGKKGLYQEEDAPNPINQYGLSKLHGEQLLKKSGASWSIARTSVVYGWGREYQANFATWLHQKLSTQQVTRVVIDQYASPTLNTQLARMLLEVAERGLKGIFHLAGSTRINRYQFALGLARRFGFDENLIVPVKSESVDWKAKRPFDSSLNITKALETLNSKPVPTEMALEEFAREAPKP